MLTNWRLPPSLVTGLLLLGAGTASAQRIPSPYRYVDESQSITLFGGYVLTDAGALELGPRSGPIGGLRYSLRLGGPFNVEASAGYLPTTRIVWDTAGVDQPPERLGEADLSLLLADASLRFNITGPRTYHGFMPFALLGGGIALAVSEDDDLEEAAELAAGTRFDFGTRFAGHVGAGIEWFAMRRLALRAEARDVFWKLGTPQAFQALELDVPDSEWVQNFVLSLGVAYHF